MKKTSEIPLEDDKIAVLSSTYALHIRLCFILGGTLLIAVLVGCSSVHIFGGRSTKVFMYGSSSNWVDTAMQAPSETREFLNPNVPIDEINVGPGEIPMIGGGIIGGGTPVSPDLDAPPGSDTPASDAPASPPMPSGLNWDNMPPPPAPSPDDHEGLDEKFLWKPKSKSDGRLVNLTPQSLTLDQLDVRGESGTLRSRTNGNRQHWRFAKPGAAYGVNVPVTGRYKGRVIVRYTVPNGGQRYSKKLEPLPSWDEPEEPTVPVGDQTHIRLNGRDLVIGSELGITRISGAMVGGTNTKIDRGNPLTRWTLPTGDQVFFQMETGREGNRLYHCFTNAGKLVRYQYFVGGDWTLNSWNHELHTYSEDLWKHWGDTQPLNKGKYELLAGL